MLISLGSYYIPKAAGGWTLAELFTAGQDGLAYETTIGNLYTDSAGTTLVSANGDPVGNATDLYGTTVVDATQDTASNKPLYQVSGKMVSYDGVDDYLDTGVGRVGGTGLFCDANETFFMAIAVRVQPGSTDGTIVSRCATALDDRTFMIYITGNTGEQPVIRARGEITPTYWDINDGSLHVIWVNWDGTTLEAGANNRPVLTTTIGVGAAAEQTAETIKIGARGSSPVGYFQEAEIGSMVIRDTSATAQEITDTVDYLLALHA